MKPPQDLIMLAPGVWVEPHLLNGALAQAVPAPPPASNGHGEGLVLPEDHPMWDHGSGGDRNDPALRWRPGDLAEAAITLAGVKGKKAGRFFDILLSQPGRLFSVADLMEIEPEFTSAHSVAGCLNGFRLHIKRAGRHYPFYWWEGEELKTRYAVRPSVAEIFLEAGRRDEG